jgi:mRNA-degrading endonuclease toxin of MazEF toxin-antitoxin module
MKRPEQGDLFYLKWDPSIGHEYKNNRPGVVISSPAALKSSNLITFMALTSNVYNKKQDDILLHKNSLNNLCTDSVIKVQHISTFDPERILNYLGKVDTKILEGIKSYLKKHFDIS